jgi:hypothetical protein
VELVYLRFMLGGIILCLSHLAAAAPLFEDDGSGNDPNSGLPNTWALGSGWALNKTMAEISTYPQYAGSAAAAELTAILGADNPVIIAEFTAEGSSMASAGPVLQSGMPALTQVVSTHSLPDGGNRVTFIFDSFTLNQNEADGLVTVELQSPTYILSNIGIGGPALTPKTDGKDDYWVAITAKPMIHRDLKVFDDTEFGTAGQFALSTSNSLDIPAADFTDLDFVKRMSSFGVVPEPSALLLLWSGGIALLCWRRDR